MAAALALRELADDAEAPTLRQALRDPIAAVRRLAIDALAGLQPDAANESVCPEEAR